MYTFWSQKWLPLYFLDILKQYILKYRLNKTTSFMILKLLEEHLYTHLRSTKHNILSTGGIMVQSFKVVSRQVQYTTGEGGSVILEKK